MFDMVQYAHFTFVNHNELITNRLVQEALFMCKNYYNYHYTNSMR